MSLIDQLTTAIAQTEHVAQKAIDASQRPTSGGIQPQLWREIEAGSITSDPGSLRVADGPIDPRIVNHILRQQPARVLALCQAHREIVDEYLRVLKDRKKRHGDLGLAGALLALHGVVGIVARGYGITEEDTCD